MIAGSTIEDVLFFLNRKAGHLVPWKIKKRIADFLYPEGSVMPMMLNVDITSSCNLRCPSCPVGNTNTVDSHGIMDKEFFRTVIRKARDEHKVKLIAPYNWTEPFLHPELPDFIRIIKQEKLTCLISTNLNIRRHIEEVVVAAPDFIRISVSGFYQESYGKTHARGDIEVVKANMKLLSEALKKHGRNKTMVTVYYHKYLHNLPEKQLMQDYAKSLGFEWMEYWAGYLSVEKLLQYMDGTIATKEKEFIENELALPVAQAAGIARLYHNPNQCIYLKNHIILDYKAHINLCCVSYDKSNQIGDFMQLSDAQVKQAKQGHPTCAKCSHHGLDRYFTASELPGLREQFEELAQSRADAITRGASADE